MLTAFVCLLLTEPAHSDDFAAHLKALEAKNAAKPKPVEAPKYSGWQTGDRSFYRGKWWTLRADGWWYADPARPPLGSGECTYYDPVTGQWFCQEPMRARGARSPILHYAPPPIEAQPAPVYYQPRAFRFFGGGNCGPSG